MPAVNANENPSNWLGFVDMSPIVDEYQQLLMEIYNNDFDRSQKMTKVFRDYSKLTTQNTANSLRDKKVLALHGISAGLQVLGAAGNLAPSLIFSVGGVVDNLGMKFFNSMPVDVARFNGKFDLATSWFNSWMEPTSKVLGHTTTVLDTYKSASHTENQSYQQMANSDYTAISTEYGQKESKLEQANADRKKINDQQFEAKKVIASR